MPDPFGAAAEEAAKVATAGIVAALMAWAAIKRQAIANWKRARKAHREGLKAMVETWPSIHASSTRTTQQFTAINDKLDGLDVRMDGQDAALNEILAMNHGQFELSGQATFVCDNEGRNTLVNSAYARILGVGRDDLMGFRFKRFIAPHDLADYWPKFKAASIEHREFDGTLWFTTPKGERVHVCIRMVPHPRQQGPATHWVGTVTPCEEHE